MNEEMRKDIQRVIFQMNDRYSDGFNKFAAKQELWEIKWMIDKALDDAPTFGHTEEEWLDSRINAMTLL